MITKRMAVLVLGGASIAVPAAGALAGSGPTDPPPLVQAVRDATRNLRDVANATEFTSLGACVRGPQEGAMGIHDANGAHVWAWRDNPNGASADYDPAVSSCTDDVGGGMSGMTHGS